MREEDKSWIMMDVFGRAIEVVPVGIPDEDEDSDEEECTITVEELPESEKEKWQWASDYLRELNEQDHSE